MSLKLESFLHGTPQSSAILEKLTGLQPVNRFSAFYRTQSFFTAFITGSYMSLFWTRSIQSMFLILLLGDPF